MLSQETDDPPAQSLLRRMRLYGARDLEVARSRAVALPYARRYGDGRRGLDASALVAASATKGIISLSRKPIRFDTNTGLSWPVAAKSVLHNQCSPRQTHVQDMLAHPTSGYRPEYLQPRCCIVQNTPIHTQA